MRQGLWEKKKFMGTELYHQTLGIIGLGKIGSIVADRALSMKMEVLVFDPHIVPEMAAVLGAEYVSLDALLARSDFITVHTPLKDDTRGLIGREALAKTKWGVRILNCARRLVDEEASANPRKRSRAGPRDVFERKPRPGAPFSEWSSIFTPTSGRRASTQKSPGHLLQILSDYSTGLIATREFSS